MNMGAYKYCLRCGAKLTVGAKFCYQCGAAQPAFDKPEEPAQAVSITPAQAESAPVNRTDGIETVRIDPDAPDLKNVRMPNQHRRRRRQCAANSRIQRILRQKQQSARLKRHPL